MDAKALIVFLIVGAVAGLLASIVVGGGGLLYYIIIGVVGSFVGGFLFNALKINLSTGSAIVNQIITSAIGAIIVVLLARTVRRGRGRREAAPAVYVDAAGGRLAGCTVTGGHSASTAHSATTAVRHSAAKLGVGAAYACVARRPIRGGGGGS